MTSERACTKCDYATKEGTGYFCARWNGPTYGPNDWCFYFKPKPEGGITMKDERTTATDLSGAPEEVKDQILANDQKLKDRDSGKRNRLVYICSRYKDDPDRNVQKAQEYCREALELWPDVLPLAPHVYFTQFLDDTVPRERALGLAAGISLLDMCDEIWVYGMQNPSEGMAAEIAYAKEHGIPIVDDTELPDTLAVYLPSGAAATEGADYTATYTDDLLTLELSGELASAKEVTVKISRDMRGRVKIVPICAGGELPSEEVLADVLAACSADDVRPLTDRVTVEAPTVAYYDIDLTYYTTKANESEVVRNVEGSDGAIDRYIYWQGSNLDQDINPDYLRKLILAPSWNDGLTGATRVEINAPQFTELNSTTVAKFSGNLTVRHIVKD